MPGDYLICDPEELTVWAIRALDAGLFTNATNPFVAASGRVTSAACFVAFESTGIDIFPASEERTKEVNLSRRRRLICYQGFRNWNNAYFEPETLASFKAMSGPSDSPPIFC